MTVEFNGLGIDPRLEGNAAAATFAPGGHQHLEQFAPVSLMLHLWRKDQYQHSQLVARQQRTARGSNNRSTASRYSEAIRPL